MTIDQTTPSLYDALGGYEGLVALANAWHHRATQDAVAAYAFSHGYHPQHTERLAAYWAEALGGPTLYTTSDGRVDHHTDHDAFPQVGQ